MLVAVRPGPAIYMERAAGAAGVSSPSTGPCPFAESQPKVRRLVGLAQGVVGRALWLVLLFHGNKGSGWRGPQSRALCLGWSRVHNRDKQSSCGVGATLSNSFSGRGHSHRPGLGVPVPLSCWGPTNPRLSCGAMRLHGNLTPKLRHSDGHYHLRQPSWECIYPFQTCCSISRSLP